MARTPEQISNSIIQRKNSYPELAQLNSNSATAIYKLWADVFGTEISLMESFFEVYKKELMEILENGIIGKDKWFVKILKEFQEGDDLEILPNETLGYPVIDMSKRIIKQASYVDQPGGLILLKAAREVNGELSPLTTAQLLQANTYISKREPAGTNPSVISEPADKLIIRADIYYNPLFDFEDLKLRVQNAIVNYLKVLDFDGVVYASILIELIKDVEGVEDVYINRLTGKSLTSETIFTRAYRSRAGYLVPDNTAGNTLNETLNYIPN